jgi:hypothetical protein
MLTEEWGFDSRDGQVLRIEKRRARVAVEKAAWARVRPATEIPINAALQYWPQQPTSQECWVLAAFDPFREPEPRLDASRLE